MGAQSFVRINFDGTNQPPDGRRKLRLRHKDLRDLVTDTGKTAVDLFSDQFGGWPQVIKYASRWQDPTVTLDKASDLIDAWIESHPDAENPMKLLEDQLLEVMYASGYIKKPKSASEDSPASESEGNALPGAETR